VNSPIAILGGTGDEGFGLALRWSRAGETVIIGSRDPARAQEAAARIQNDVPDAKISGTENTQACASASIIVITVPFEGHAAMLKHVKGSLKPGSIVVDATVPLAASVGGRPSRTLGVWQGSAAQQCAELVPDTVAVVGAFHNVGSALLNSDHPVDCDVIVCGDNPEANRAIRDLARKIQGVRAIDGGRLENARILEQITALLIGINLRYKTHTGIRITALPESLQQG
jgi:NADPH-dependent F420 reductase